MRVNNQVWRSRFSRRRFLALSGSALASALLGSALGQAVSGGSRGGTASKPWRMGAIIPTLTGARPLGASVGLNAFTEDVVGGPANNGAIMAADEIDLDVGKVLITSAMGVGAVIRAAERLSSVEGCYAILGGFSAEEALSISDLAAKRDFIFLNIGAQDDALRGEACNSRTFHLSASTTMYLDAITGWGIHAGFHRWFFVYNDSDEQKANYVKAGKILKSHSSGSEVGSIMVPKNEPVYNSVLEDIKKAGPDLVVLLLGPTEQLIFSNQYKISGLNIETIGYPAPGAQTRKFYTGSLRDVYTGSLQDVPKPGSGHHVALWEATLDKHGAEELNSRFLGRFGQAMDPSAWAAYMGIKVMAEAATKAGSTESADLIEYLENPRTTFDIDKGKGTSFKPWNHQMRQPLYLVRTNPDYQDKTALQDLAILEGELPSLYEPDVPPIQRLDQFGVGEQASRCKLEGS